jgi:outer membrane biosynthesis protein TonB
LRRFTDPAVLLFIASLVGSLAVHLPTYVSLGWLAEYFAARSEADAKARRELEPQVAYFELPETLEEEPTRDDPELEPAPEEKREKERDEEQIVLVPPPPKPEPKPEPVPEKIERSTPPPPESAEHAVIQKSRDPEVEPPPDARFVADENNRVEEETVAAVTNTVRDDEQAELPKNPDPSPDKAHGADSSDELGGVRDKPGTERRPPVEATSPERHVDNRRSEQLRGDRRTQPGDIVVDDGFGTFVVRRGSDRRGEAGEGGRAERRRAINLKLGYSQLEGVIGADVLSSEREQFAEERRSRRRGKDHAEDFREFRSAIENFVSNVKVGNQTALNARRSPFAAYIQRVHLRFHEAFHELVANLPSDGAHSDLDLVTRLEIVLEANGALAAVGVVRTSGQILFDHAAFAAVKRGAPYPDAPGEITSNDGRVYLQWDFRRDPMACHQLHARPFILEGLPVPPVDRARDTVPASTLPKTR